MIFWGNDSERFTKFESWIECADSTVPLIGWKCGHTHANSCIRSSIFKLLSITYSYLHAAVSKKRTAVRKLFNRSQKSKKTRRNSAASPPHQESFTRGISKFSDSRSLCCHFVEIEDVITPHNITLFKYVLNRKANQMQPKMSLIFRGQLFLVSRKNAN